MDAQESAERLYRPCAGSKVGSTLGFWSYMYYLSKFYEMIDTVVLALKKKPLEFLQMYHHASIVMLCWSWLHGGCELASMPSIFALKTLARALLTRAILYK